MGKSTIPKHARLARAWLNDLFHNQHWTSSFLSVGTKPTDLESSTNLDQLLIEAIRVYCLEKDKYEIVACSKDFEQRRNLA